MNRLEIIEKLKNYFDIRELVCKHTYDKFKECSWQFLDTEILEIILVLRTQILCKPMVCNNWHTGGQYTQRGFRCNICEIPKAKTLCNELYNSSHCNGAGMDFTIIGMSAEDARERIKADSWMLPHPVRIERGVRWLHIDCFDSMSDQQVYEFNG